MTDKPTFDAAKARRSILLLSVALFAGVALLVIVAILTFGYAPVREAWDEATPFVTLVKWTGMAILIWRWDEFIAWAADRWHMEDGYRDYLIAIRWHVAGGLAILELLFGQNLLGRLLAL